MGVVSSVLECAIGSLKSAGVFLLQIQISAVVPVAVQGQLLFRCPTAMRIRKIPHAFVTEGKTATPLSSRLPILR